MAKCLLKLSTERTPINREESQYRRPHLQRGRISGTMPGQPGRTELRKYCNRNHTGERRFDGPVPAYCTEICERI